MNADPAAVAALIRQILAEGGPLTKSDLQEALVAADAPLGDDRDELVDDLLLSAALEQVTPLVDGRNAWLPSLLDGRIFTHRIDARELEYDVLEQTPDLGHLALLTEDPQFRLNNRPLPTVFPDSPDLPDQRSLPRRAISEYGDFVLPVGTLTNLGLRPGDLIGIRVTGDNLTVERVYDVEATPEELPDALTAFLDEDDFEIVDFIVPTLCAADDGLFRKPLSPLGETFDELGLARLGDRLALPGFDFESALLMQRMRLAQETHELTEDEASAVIQLEMLLQEVEVIISRVVDGDPSETVPAPPPDGSPAAGEIQAIQSLSLSLRNPAVATALLNDALYERPGDPRAVAALAESLEAEAHRDARAPLRWLQAMAAERLGDEAIAEKLLDEAEGLDPDWGLTLLDLARYASDRGDATRALSLMRRAGADEDDEFVTALRRYQPVPRSDMRRNAPCWCGSGRKYKACHLNNEQLSLEQRAEWLYEKACVHMRAAEWPSILIDLAHHRAHDESEEALIDAVHDPFVTDVLLVEGGGFEDFFARRSRLLPDDERELAEQWLGVKRSVYEIVDVKPQHGVTLRNVGTREQYYCQGQTLSSWRPGILLCGRLLPVQDTLRYFGALEVVGHGSLDEVLDALREQDAAALLEATSG